MDKSKNVGYLNVGYLNVGDRNVGDRNVGHLNVGWWNVGDQNVGDRNVGHRNVGYLNVGYLNVGDLNVGHRNVGHQNVGYLNVGDQNVGDRNVGDRNVGHLNVGWWNVGWWNVGNLNVGHLNTITPDKIQIFNKPCCIELWNNTQKPSWMYFELVNDTPKWLPYNDLSCEDKQKYPISEKMGGYLLGGIRKELSQEEKIKLYKEGAQKSWNNTTQKDRELTLKLPNFDADIFFEIFGIDVRTKTITMPHLPTQLSEISTDDILKELKNRFIDN